MCSSSGQRGDSELRGDWVAVSGKSNGHGLPKEVPKGAEMSMCWLNADHYKEFKQEKGFKQGSFQELQSSQRVVKLYGFR